MPDALAAALRAGVSPQAVVLYSIHTMFTRWLRRGHPPGRGRWHAPSSRHLRALLSVCGRCSSEGLGCCSCRVCRCRCRGCCSLSVCVCDVLIFLHRIHRCALFVERARGCLVGRTSNMRAWRRCVRAPPRYLPNWDSLRRSWYICLHNTPNIDHI